MWTKFVRLDTAHQRGHTNTFINEMGGDTVTVWLKVSVELLPWIYSINLWQTFCIINLCIYLCNDDDPRTQLM
jgi:hypothetical protein